jgi:hypothetical protein
MKVTAYIALAITMALGVQAQACLPTGCTPLTLPPRSPPSGSWMMDY